MHDNHIIGINFLILRVFDLIFKYMKNFERMCG